MEIGEETRFRSGNEAAEHGQKGGIASGQARRAKKTLRERVKMFGELKVEGKSARAMADMGIEPEDHDRFTQAAVSLFQKALKGDVAAFNAIRDIIGEKPKDEVAQTIDMHVEIGFVDAGVEPKEREDEVDDIQGDT